MSRRFVVIVIDSFGVGAMDDVVEVRKNDIGANTALHLLQYPKMKQWQTLLSLGLMNAIGQEEGKFKKSTSTIYGIANLGHYGADSFFGHQEIMGTNPKKPVFSKLSDVIEKIDKALQSNGYTTKRVTKEGKEILSVNDCMFVGDNIETDLGQAFNVIGALDICGFDEIQRVGNIVRKSVEVARVIAFGGSKVNYQDLVDNIRVFTDYIGVDAPNSGVYKNNYHVVHLGYGVDTKVQVQTVLYQKNIPSFFYGKVADIVGNSSPNNYSCVDTATCLQKLVDDLQRNQMGFYCLNVQETDLAGHTQDANRYIDCVTICDDYLKRVIHQLDTDDILIICADHGNDPTIGHAKHTREKVPLLIYSPMMKKGVIDIGDRETLADIGATVAEYFGCIIDNGTSFLPQIVECDSVNENI